MNTYLAQTAKKPPKRAVKTSLTDIEVEATERETSGGMCALEDDSLEPYADEPLADEEWLRVYRKEQQEKLRVGDL